NPTSENSKATKRSFIVCSSVKDHAPAATLWKEADDAGFEGTSYRRGGGAGTRGGRCPRASRIPSFSAEIQGLAVARSSPRPSDTSNVTVRPAPRRSRRLSETGQ